MMFYPGFMSHYEPIFHAARRRRRNRKILVVAGMLPAVALTGAAVFFLMSFREVKRD